MRPAHTPTEKGSNRTTHVSGYACSTITVASTSKWYKGWCVCGWVTSRARTHTHTHTHTPIFSSHRAATGVPQSSVLVREKMKTGIRTAITKMVVNRASTVSTPPNQQGTHAPCTFASSFFHYFVDLYDRRM